MKLYEILAEIDTRFPNTLTAEDKITFLNHTIRDIYTFCGEMMTYRASAECDVVLPDHIRGENVREVFVNDAEYFEKGKKRKGAQTYTIENGVMKLSGAGDGILTIRYISYMPFKTLADTLQEGTAEEYEAQSGGISDRFAELLVLGALYRAAAAEEDMTAAGNFKRQYEERRLAAMMERYKRGLYPITKIVR